MAYNYCCVLKTDIKGAINEKFNYNKTGIKELKTILESKISKQEEDCEITLAYADAKEVHHPMDGFTVHIFELIKEDGKVYKNDYKTRRQTEYDEDLAHLMEYALL